MLLASSRRMAGKSGFPGELVRLRSPREAIRQGIALLPEDRHLQGLVLPFPIRANVTLPILRRLSADN